MKRLLTVVALFSLLLTSCSDDSMEGMNTLHENTKNACTAENPMELEWMQGLKQELHCGEFSCKVSIFKSEYDGETVFYIAMTDPLCNGVLMVDLYNCSGDKVKELTREESRDFVFNHENESEEIFSCNG